MTHNVMLTAFSLRRDPQDESEERESRRSASTRTGSSLSMAWSWTATRSSNWPSVMDSRVITG
jgi:hypothetical protein